MTHEQFRTAVTDQHAANRTNALLAGHSDRVANLAQQIEDHLQALNSRQADAMECAREGNLAQARHCKAQADRHIAAARSLIALPGGREAYALYQERTS